jgi:hypothetical protein
MVCYAGAPKGAARPRRDGRSLPTANVGDRETGSPTAAAAGGGRKRISAPPRDRDHSLAARLSRSRRQNASSQDQEQNNNQQDQTYTAANIHLDSFWLTTLYEK